MTTRDMPAELVDRVRHAMQESGQSLNQLSAACGIDRGRLSRFMRGERDLTLAAAGRLCKVLGLELVQAGALPAPAAPAAKGKAPKAAARPRKGQ